MENVHVSVFDGKMAATMLSFYAVKVLAEAVDVAEKTETDLEQGIKSLIMKYMTAPKGILDDGGLSDEKADELDFLLSSFDDIISDAFKEETKGMGPFGVSLMAETCYAIARGELFKK